MGNDTTGPQGFTPYSRNNDLSNEDAAEEDDGLIDAD